MIFIYKRKKKVLARLNPLKIYQSVPELYPRLVQYVNGQFYDGNGNLLRIGLISNPNRNKLVISDGTNTGLVTLPNVSFENETLILNSNFQLINGTEQDGYHLVTDTNGLATWTSSRSFYYQTGTPSPNPLNVGSRWIDSDNRYEYIWVSDGTSSSWIQPTTNNYATNEINTSSYSVSFEYTYYGVIHNSSICEIYLPLGGSSSDNGKFITIADEVGGISSFNKGIKVYASGSQSINGYSDVLMKVNFMSLTFLFRNGNWKTI